MASGFSIGSFIGGFIGGSFFTYLVQLIFKKGGTFLKDGKAEIIYDATNNVFESAKIHLQFINESGHIRNVSDISAQLLFKSQLHDLIFPNQPFTPILKLGEKEEKVIDLEAALKNSTKPLSMSMLNSDECRIKVMYKVKNRAMDFYIDEIPFRKGFEILVG